MVHVCDALGTPADQFAEDKAAISLCYYHAGAASD